MSATIIYAGLLVLAFGLLADAAPQQTKAQPRRPTREPKVTTVCRRSPALKRIAPPLPPRARTVRLR